MKRVLVVQRRLTHYRVPFFTRLRTDLADAGLALTLAHGEPTAAECSKQDSGELDWAVRLPTRYALGGRLCWQPFAALAAQADLAVVTAENKLLCNLRLQFGAVPARVALWGHGGNLQGDPRSWRERFKRRVALQADWWLAYTEMSRDLVAAMGFPPERITVLNNAVDTAELRAQFAAVTPEAQAALRAELGLAGGPVGVYIGSLYAEKRIDFLLDAARELRRQVPGFELLVVGGGPLAGLVTQAALGSPWIKVLGVRTGAAKALAMSLAQIYLHPGALGLGVLDAFAAGLPMLTMPSRQHGPEFAYLSSGINSVVTQPSLSAFTSAAVGLLSDDAARARLRQGCLAGAERYTLAQMSERFTAGAVAALQAPGWRGRS